MNGAEQKQHSKVTARLSDDLDTIEALLHETGKRVTANKADLSHQARRLDEHNVRLMTIDRRLETFQRFGSLGFWGRLNWLIRGVLQ